MSESACGLVWFGKGIPEGWLVDLVEDAIFVHRDPSPEGYRTVVVVRRGERQAPLTFPELVVAAEDILGGRARGTSAIHVYVIILEYGPPVRSVMGTALFVSRLREVLGERNLRVVDLQRRLEGRGYHVSRGALDRLMSERPIDEVNLRVLVPVLEELDVDPRSAIRVVDADEHAARTRAREAVREATRTIAASAAGSGQQREAQRAADRELAEVSARLEAELREQSPELFDARGRLRKRAFQQWLLKRAGGRTYLGKKDLLALTAKG